MKYFEDLHEDLRFDLGTTFVSEADILEFARRYDPQPFHIDPIAASASMFCGLIASGIHTLAIYMRLFVDGLLGDAASLGSPGIDAVRWPAPVRAGDTLTGTYTVVSTRVSSSRPQWGVVVGRGEVVNQDSEAVLFMTLVNLFGRNPERSDIGTDGSPC
jgi:acyl dehydratase